MDRATLYHIQNVLKTQPKFNALFIVLGVKTKLSGLFIPLFSMKNVA